MKSINMKNKINAEIVADSINQQGDRLTSLLITFPRIILAEVNTHRMLSKNTSSSRAIPFNKMVEAVKNDPFIPIAWQKHHSGMQGNEYITDQKIIDFKKGVWINNMHKAVKGAEELYYPVSQARSMTDIKEIPDTGVTKQLCNRLLEPFMWTTMLITGSKEGWNNFFELRCPSYEIELQDDLNNPMSDWSIHKFKSKKDLKKDVYSDDIDNYNVIEWLTINKGQAEIHIMDLAEKIYDAMNESTPEQLQSGEWHIPFKDKINDKEQLRSIQLTTNPLKEGIYTIGEGSFIVRTGRGGMLDYFNTIQSELGIDPFESIKVMISTAMAARTSYTIIGEEKEIDYAKMIELHDRLIAQDPPHSSPMEHCCLVVTEEEYNNSFKGREKGWFRNYKGFKSYREIIESFK